MQSISSHLIFFLSILILSWGWHHMACVHLLFSFSIRTASWGTFWKLLGWCQKSRSPQNL
jgi:hypothetical protein